MTSGDLKVESSQKSLFEVLVVIPFTLGASLMAQTVKCLPTNAGDQASISESGRSAGEGNGNPLQYYCLENPMDRGGEHD